MAKTENFTHYTCDQYGNRATRLLCKGCTDEYKKLAAKHDGEFQQFMSNAKE